MKNYISLGFVAFSFFLIRFRLSGLPERIPIHFNASGKADSWGRPETLWYLLMVQTAGTLLFVALPYISRRVPQLINLGTRRLVDFPPNVRARVFPLLDDMVAYMGLLFGAFFSYMIYNALQLASQATPHFQSWPIWVYVGGTLVVVFYYLGRINRVAESPKSANAPIE
jgi:Domain of unknown function (DUF1648)